MTDLITVETLKQALPRNLQGNATQEFADKVNGIAKDPEYARAVRENFITYAQVLKDGRYKTEDYLNAVTYCTYKLMEYSNKDAYAKTFPDRWNLLVLKGTSDKDISSHVAAYNKNKLVTLILEQAAIPAWLMYQDAFHKAVAVQLELMTTANSEKVRQDAANSVLTHLKAPEIKKVQLDVGMSDTGGIADLMEMMTRVAEVQIEQINKGATAKQMGHLPLYVKPDPPKEEPVDAEFTPVDDSDPVSLFP